MPRKLKSYVTSLGFFDQAIAAPSMKAALSAWGAESNLFHQGVAKESNDPEVVAATMAHPGIVLKRPVGSDGPFREHPTLPRHLTGADVEARRQIRRTKGKQAAHQIDDQARRDAAVAFEKVERRRELEQRKEEAKRAKELEHRQRAIAKAGAAFEKAKRSHEQKVSGIEAEREALDKRSEAEEARWEKQKQKLESALGRGRD